MTRDLMSINQQTMVLCTEILSNIICDKFGADRKHTKGGSTLRFDPEKLVKVGETYNLKTEIQSKITVGNHGDGDGGDGSKEGKGSYTQNPDLKNTNKMCNTHEKLPNNDMNITNSSSQNHDKNLEAPQEPSQPSPSEAVEQQIPNSIYRLGHSDRWVCNNCKVKGDKWFMLTHPEYCKARSQSKQLGGLD